ncbi:MAG: FtsX-like permease family protein [Sphingobacteriales bacterium]|nr:MAG: FtsX-like permease family protein [Sphingobacteriales bacterium]
MLKNYLKIAWRNLLKNKTFSLINIIGLASGLACFILIALYVADELSYDRYHEKANRIYRINSDIVFGGNKLNLAVTSDPMGETLKKDYPQVEAYTRLYNSDGYRMVKKGSQYIREDNVAHADSTLFDVFTIPLIAGEARTALNEPKTVIVSESTAKKYYGTTDVVGKLLETDEHKSTIYKITGVFKDIPHNSHFKLDLVFTMQNLDYQMGNFLSHNFQTYIVLQPGVNYKNFEKNFTQVIDKYVLPQAKQFMNINSMDEFKKAGNRLEYNLIPLTDIHLHSDRRGEMGVNGNIQYVYIFSAVAVFVLLLACINFMNLSTARSSNRAKEVGIRKVLGTERKSLVNQFLTESTLTVFIATVFAIAIVWVTMSWFNDLSGKQLLFFSLFQPQYILFLAALPLVVGLLAGGYPAFFLSSFKPIAVLKGKINAGFKRSALRNVLVVFQFATSIILIVGTIIVYRQLNFIQTKKLGFNKEQVLIVNGTGGLWNKSEAFKEDVSKLAGVSGATFAGYLPVSNSSRNDNTYSTSPVMDSKNGFNMQTWIADYDYFKVMGMEMVKGRAFSKDFGTDTSALIINESLAKILGFKDPVGQKLYTYFQDQSGNKLVTYNIIGVVKDFHFESLRQGIGPLCFRLGKPDWVTAFKVNTSNINDLVKNVEAKWKTYAPSMPFSYQFLDDAFDNMYRVEQRTGKLGLTLAIIAIVIACLGLFGLATYMAEQRIKEIGVRKVLGASVTNLVSMLSKDFLRLVIISTVLAVPLSWWAMNKWLQDFAYRINIGWWVFAAAGVLALLIAVLTVSSQAIKAALTNPVKSLRTE